MATRIHTVCLIQSSYAPAFARLGVRVVVLDPPAGIASLPELLAQLPEPPDCVIHQEHLGKRLILTDLDAAPCPTIFWARDPHLNFFWQRHYARQFSAVASTQPQHAAAFAAAGAPRTAWITWNGWARPCTPFAQRHRELAFVGRLSSSRCRREWFAAHLAKYGLTPEQDVFGEALAAVYNDARLAPNECIAGEINQRLFEAASSGCLPLSERTPEAVAELFVPDREALYYDDVLELDDRLRFAAAHPALLEKMGQAAHAAVNQRHLPEHRAKSLLALAETATAIPKGPEAAAATALTLFHLRRAGHLLLSGDMVWDRLSAAPPTPEVVAAMVHLALSAGDRETVLHLAGICLARPDLAADLQTATACCLAACRLDEMEVAKRAYVAWVGATGKRQVPRLEDAYAYLLFFANALEASDRALAPGMPFDPERHLPNVASECLIAAKSLRPDALEADRRLEVVLRRQPGTQPDRVGLLSRLSLHRREDWSLGLELGLANLQAFRREAGLEEVALAAITAERLGEHARFARRLRLADPSGRLRLALSRRTQRQPQQQGRCPCTPPGG